MEIVKSTFRFAIFYYQFGICLFMITKKCITILSTLIFWQWVSFEKCITLSLATLSYLPYILALSNSKNGLFSSFFKNIENSDDIIISGDFRRYFRPEPGPILSTFLYCYICKNHKQEI